jgi:hypothetical protein
MTGEPDGLQLAAELFGLHRARLRERLVLLALHNVRAASGLACMPALDEDSRGTITMKRYILLLCLLAAASCAESLPTPRETMVTIGDLLSRFQGVYTATDDAYWALCKQREEAPECVEIRHYLDSVVVATNELGKLYLKANDKFKEAAQ